MLHCSTEWRQSRETRKARGGAPTSSPATGACSRDRARRRLAHLVREHRIRPRDARPLARGPARPRRVFLHGLARSPAHPRADLLTPVALMLGFAPLYLAGVYDWPVQVNSDEVGIMVTATHHSDLAGADPFGVSNYLGHPILLFWIFGSRGEAIGGVTLEHMRLVHGFVGLAVVALAYGLFRQVTSRSVSLVACCLLGFTHSLFMISLWPCAKARPFCLR